MLPIKACHCPSLAVPAQMFPTGAQEAGTGPHTCTRNPKCAASSCSSTLLRCFTNATNLCMSPCSGHSQQKIMMLSWSALRCCGGLPRLPASLHCSTCTPALHLVDDACLVCAPADHTPESCGRCLRVRASNTLRFDVCVCVSWLQASGTLRVNI